MEMRGIDLGYKVLQVFTDAPKFKISERGEDCACQWRWASACSIRARLRGMETEFK